MLHGHFEAFDGAVVSGWCAATDSANKLGQVEVAVLSDNTEIVRAMADQYREDLKQAGIGDGRHAFRIRLPLEHAGAGAAQFQIVESKSGSVLAGTPVKNESWLKVERDVRYRGDGMVEGWVHLVDFPDQRAQVEFSSGGEVIASTLATRYREDLARSGKGNGECAFEAALPLAQIRDGLVEVTGLIQRRRFELVQLQINDSAAVVAAKHQRSEGRAATKPSEPTPPSAAALAGRNAEAAAVAAAPAPSSTTTTSEAPWTLYYPLGSTFEWARDWERCIAQHGAVGAAESKAFRRNPFAKMGLDTSESVEAQRRTSASERPLDVWIVFSSAQGPRLFESLVSLLTQGRRPSRIILVDESGFEGKGRVALRLTDKLEIPFDVYGADEALRSIVSAGRDRLIMRAGTVLRSTALGNLGSLDGAGFELAGLLARAHKYVRGFTLALDMVALGGSRIVVSEGQAGALYLPASVEVLGSGEQTSAPTPLLLDLRSRLAAAKMASVCLVKPQFTALADEASNFVRLKKHGPQIDALVVAFDWSVLRQQTENLQEELGTVVRHLTIITTPGLALALSEATGIAGLPAVSIVSVESDSANAVRTAVTNALSESGAAFVLMMSGAVMPRRRLVRHLRSIWRSSPDAVVDVVDPDRRRSAGVQLLDSLDRLWRPASGGVSVDPFPPVELECIAAARDTLKAALELAAIPEHGFDRSRAADALWSSGCGLRAVGHSVDQAEVGDGIRLWGDGQGQSGLFGPGQRVGLFSVIGMYLAEQANYEGMEFKFSIDQKDFNLEVPPNRPGPSSASASAPAPKVKQGQVILGPNIDYLVNVLLPILADMEGEPLRDVDLSQGDEDDAG